MPKMKYSGIEWVGNIPEEWKKIRLKDIYTFEKGKKSQLYTQEYIGENLGEYPVYSGQTENEGIMGKINSYDYDIDECIFTTTVGAKCMTLKILGGKFSLSQNCLIMKRKTNNNNKYVYYSLIPLFEYERSKIPSYMQPSLRIDDLNKYHLYLPKIKEQILIVEFLDEKTKKIDEILNDLNVQIEILNKYRKSLITEVTTKGLNKDIKTKPSNIKWIESIPETWTISKIKYKFDVICGSTPESDNNEYWNGKINWITPADMSDFGTISKGERTLTEKGYKSCGTTLLPVNSIVISTRAPIGKINYVTSELCTNQGCKSLISKSNNKYYYYYLLGFKENLSKLGTGTTFMELSTESLKNFPIIIPTTNEQEEIAKYLDTKCEQIDKIIQEKQKQIEIMETYKKNVIYEYVTGKKRVEGVEKIYE